MTDLNQSTIDAIHKISEALKGTNFWLNRFTVDSAGNGALMIELDIREELEGKE